MGVGKRAPERSASRVTGAAYCHDERCATVNVSAGGFAGGRPRGVRRLYKDSHTTSIFNPLTRCLSALLIDGDHVEEQCTLMESGSIKSRGHFHAQQIYSNVSDERQGRNARVRLHIRPAIERGCYCACFFHPRHSR